MATNPDQIEQQEADRRRAAEAAALALLLLARKPLPQGARYSLPDLIASAKVKPRDFRRIEPTEAMRANLASPYFDVVRAWQAERARLLAVYASALPDRGASLGPNAVAELQRAIDAAERRVAAKLSAITGRFEPEVRRLATWHRAQWVQRVKAATGIDVAALTGQADVAANVANAIAANAQAARALSSEIAGKAAASLTEALVANMPASAAATGLSGALDASKKRAARRGIDAADGLSGGMTRARRIAAGIEKWRWRHSPTVRYPRPVHVARDRKVFGPGNQPSELPGVLRGCQCWEEPVL